jgi:hypothetical protein
LKISLAKPPGELLEFLYRYGAGVQSLALGLRKVVLEELAPCHEYIFEMRSKVVLLYGTSAKVMATGICDIAVFKNHVNLGFRRGADLQDALGMLKGTGKGMRHITLKTLSELDRPELRTYLRQARRHAVRGQPRPKTGEVVTRVKPRSFRKIVMPGEL